MSDAVRSSVLVLCALLLPSAADAQTTTPPTTSSASPQQPAAEVPDPDLQLNPAEPDFTLGALPTSLRMPAGKFGFRMTHRFTRPIASGSAGQFFADFFGFDSASRVGLEVRYGLRPGTQLSLHRTNTREIQLLGQHEFLDQRAGRPVTIHGLFALDGSNNFSENFAAALGGVLSRQFAERGAVYLQPIVVLNANPDSIDGEDDHAFMVGIGGRWRIGSSRVYVVVEAAPQVAGWTTGVDHVSIGIERRAGGHMFQLTVSNSLGTTLRQVALGGVNSDDWYIGFNLTRRFF